MGVRIITRILSIPLAGLLMLAIEYFCLGEKSQALNVIFDMGALIKERIDVKTTFLRISYYFLSAFTA